MIKPTKTMIKKPEKPIMRKLPLYLKKILVLFFYIMDVPSLTMSPEEIDRTLYNVVTRKNLVKHLNRNQKALLTLYLNKHNAEVWYAKRGRKKST